MSRRTFFIAALTTLAACSDPTALPPVQFENVVDTTVLYALTGTPISAPSGFDGVGGQRIRTDLGRAFDMAVEIADDGRVEVLPAGALGIGDQAGIVKSTQRFDSLASAPLEGYVTDSATVVALGDVFVLRSRNSTESCSVNSSLPRYTKFRVLAIDELDREITLEFLVNRNCGYRSLEPGVPSS